MHKNETVASVSIEENGLVLNSIINPHWMPFGIKENKDSSLSEQITMWNGDRCIPIGRPNYKQLKEFFGVNQAADWVAKSYMCSLTDCYWFKPEGADAKWEDVNFHQNGFDSSLYKYLFAGDFSAAINNLHSPDLTTDGAEPKAWFKGKDGFYLIKHHSDDTPITVCNEFLVSQIFQRIGLNCVDYQTYTNDGKLYCACKCFIDSDKEEFVPAESLMREYGYNMENISELMNRLGFQKEFSEMIIGDYLVGNADRHSHNFGVIINSDTKDILRFAPLFDHGVSYIYQNMDFMFYTIGISTFGEAIKSVDIDSLKMVRNFQEKDFIEILDSTPYFDVETKSEIYNELYERIDRIEELIIERELDDHDREY